MIRFGSLFSGAGGFDLGLERAGLTCAYQCEIDPWASSVLRRHWPDVPKWSDITTVDPAELPPVDVIAFGSPCQDLSVAGQRAGLDGARSDLFHEAIRIVRHQRPAFVIWENVPGALSSNGGRDFGAVLDSLAECGAVDIAWRILNARYWGVAQRRRRVFVVADFGGRRAAEVLAFSDRGGRHSAASREAREGIAGGIGSGVAGTGGGVAATLRVPSNGATWRGDGCDNLVARSQTSRNQRIDGESENFVIQTAQTGRNGLGDTKAVTYTLDGANSQAVTISPIGQTNRGQATGAQAETLRSDSHGAIPMVTSIAMRGREGGAQAELGGDLAFALRSGDGGSSRSALVALGISENQRAELKLTDYARSIGNGGGKPGQGYPAALTAAGVRRLMPVECERLQSWPDNHTRWTDDGREIPDTHRYRLIGNGVASNVPEWFGRRLVAAMETQP